MDGLNLDKYAHNSATFALAKCQVEFIQLVADSLLVMRKSRSLSQTEMAKRLGVSQARIAQIESGRPEDAPSLEQIAAYAFHCDHPIKLSFSDWTRAHEKAIVAA